MKKSKQKSIKAWAIVDDKGKIAKTSCNYEIYYDKKICEEVCFDLFEYNKSKVRPIKITILK